jgi:hypothetical protein
MAAHPGADRARSFFHHPLGHRVRRHRAVTRAEIYRHRLADARRYCREPSTSPRANSARRNLGQFSHHVTAGSRWQRALGGGGNCCWGCVCAAISQTSVHAAGRGRGGAGHCPPFHALVHTRSNLQLRASLAQSALTPGAEIHLRAVITNTASRSRHIRTSSRR